MVTDQGFGVKSQFLRILTFMLTLSNRQATLLMSIATTDLQTQRVLSLTRFEMSLRLATLI